MNLASKKLRTMWRWPNHERCMAISMYLEVGVEFSLLAYLLADGWLQWSDGRCMPCMDWHSCYREQWAFVLVVWHFYGAF